MANNIEIFTVLKELNRISGFRVVLYGADYKEIASYPPRSQAFCRLVQGDGSVKDRCLRCDGNAFHEARKTGKPYFYTCYFGLCEVVAPLYHFGVLSGFLMMGQVRIAQQGEHRRLLRLASDYVKDPELLNKAVNQLPVVERDLIDSYVNVMTICAEYITLSGKLGPPSNGLTAQVRKYINLNYSKKITLEGLCKHFKCSKTTLMTAFKKESYQTVVGYINEVRLERSLNLLQNTEESISDIALACGFCDQCYFSKLFTKRYGINPSRYRKENKRPSEIEKEILP